MTRGPTPAMVRELLRRGMEVRLDVFGTSMLPLIPPGATVLIRATTPDDLRTGDIVALERGQRTVCHVVEEIVREPDGRSLLRTGGTSAWSDPVASWDSVLGRVTEVRVGPVSVQTRSGVFRMVRGVARPFRPLLRLIASVARPGRVRDALSKRDPLWLVGQVFLAPLGAIWGLGVRVRYELDSTKVDLGTPCLKTHVSMAGKEVVVSAISREGGELGKWTLRKGNGLEHVDLSLGTQAPSVLAALLRATLEHGGKVSALVAPLDRATMSLFRLAGAGPVALVLTYRRRGERVTIELPLHRT